MKIIMFLILFILSFKVYADELVFHLVSPNPFLVYKQQEKDPLTKISEQWYFHSRDLFNINVTCVKPGVIDKENDIIIQVSNNQVINDDYKSVIGDSLVNHTFQYNFKHLRKILVQYEFIIRCAVYKDSLIQEEKLVLITVFFNASI